MCQTSVLIWYLMNTALSTKKELNSLESPWVDLDCVAFYPVASNNVQQYLLLRILTCVTVFVANLCSIYLNVTLCSLQCHKHCLHTAPFVCLSGDDRHRSACTVVGSRASATPSGSFRDACICFSVVTTPSWRGLIMGRNVLKLRKIFEKFS